MKVTTLFHRLRREVPELSGLIQDELRSWKSDGLPEDLFHSDLLHRVLLDYLRSTDIANEGPTVDKLFNFFETLMQESDENVVNAVEVYFGEALLNDQELYSRVQLHIGPLLNEDLERMKKVMELEW